MRRSDRWTIWDSHIPNTWHFGEKSTICTLCHHYNSHRPSSIKDTGRTWDRLSLAHRPVGSPTAAKRLYSEVWKGPDVSSLCSHHYIVLSECRRICRCVISSHFICTLLECHNQLIGFDWKPISIFESQRKDFWMATVAVVSLCKCARILCVSCQVFIFVCLSVERCEDAVTQLKEVFFDLDNDGCVWIGPSDAYTIKMIFSSFRIEDALWSPAVWNICSHWKFHLFTGRHG